MRVSQVNHSLSFATTFRNLNLRLQVRTEVMDGVFTLRVTGRVEKATVKDVDRMDRMYSAFRKVVKYGKFTLRFNLLIKSVYDDF